MNDEKIGSEEFKKLKRTYIDNFSLGHLGADVSRKLALIGMICDITYKVNQKQPVTHYEIIKKLTEGMDLPDRFLCGLAIICEDISYGSVEFPTFGIEKDKVIPTVKEILQNYLPF